ncbi:MAG TPA: hypothetical protein VJB58_01040 [Candidatus Paceibacterota bacterium]
MTKKLLTFGILAIVMVGVFAPMSVFGAACTPEQLAAGWKNLPGAGIGATVNCSPPAKAGQSDTPVLDLLSDAVFASFGPLIKGITGVIMALSAGVLWLSGTLFDEIVKYSIIETAKNIGGEEGTIGESISQAWAALRDVANMFFIFVLLFVAFKAMFSLSFGDVGKNVLNIIIVALLINFSLFFSKIVIDASNIAAIGFYNSITNARVSSEAGEGSTVGNSGGQSTITTGYMRLLGLNSLYDPKTLLQSPDDASQMLIHGVMSSIFLLITAVIFLIAAIMFAARFVILIFLMILSPLALIALIIPGQSGKFNTWKNALIDQSFFAPIFFAMTWVVFKVGIGLEISKGLLGANSATLAAGLKNPSPDGMQLILNYVIIIGLSIAALIFSKQMASKTAGFTAISGAIGTGAIGGAALMGRQSFGRAASRLEKSQRFQRLAAQHQKTFGTLYSGTQKMARGSFDVRSSDTIKKVPGLGKELDILGTPSEKGKGGFEKYREEKTKRVIEKGKQFTDRQARVAYARNIASKIHAHRGSTPNNVNSLFGMMGRSNRVAAATLIDERIRELRTDMNAARGELNTLNNQMGFTPNTGAYVGVFTAPAGMLATLTPAEQARYTILAGPAATNGSVANMSAEMQTLNDPATGLRSTLGLDNTLRQQF